MRAEELALASCSQGLEIRCVWSEKELVFSFGGGLVPGTPDGMFETWDGALTCVQVVRVPLVPGFDVGEAQETLAQTVLTKVVKSQSWLLATHVVPNDFVIFCWLPFEVPDDVVAHAEALMERVRHLDHRFVLRVRVPAAPGSLFPARFACNHHLRKAYARTVSESEVTAYGSDEDTDDDAACTWDITWSWDWDLADFAAAQEECVAGLSAECVDAGMAVISGDG
mmetsp:Transcript_113082/g.314447  ORF Transcript_113082/g.314447 Transcript_113082/m.314447 type:complete len:225 (-) Transcript_113082:268-942(-)